MSTTRRQFLSASAGSSALVALSPGIPGFLLQAAADTKKHNGDNVLVVIQLSGGNDGLNTIVPYADDIYHRNRVTLAVGRDQVLKIDDHIGLHPSLSGFADLLQNGKLSVLQGVGYERPDRSHFTSMDIWHTARREPTGRATGWLGRALDAAGPQDGHGVSALHLGPENQPLALTGDRVHSLSVRSIDAFRLKAARNKKLRDVIEKTAASRREGDNQLLGFLQESTSAALTSSRRIADSLGKYKTDIKYPQSTLGRKLKTIAQMINAALQPQVYYVSIGGFDTHSQQGEAHAALLSEVGDAVAALTNDLAQHGHGDRVLTMMFSEFGRRVRENASQGTDHGAAAPMFVAGGQVQAGPIGKHPSLDKLEDGDIVHHTDFRRVYATLLQKHLGWNSAKALGKNYQPLKFLG